MDRYPMAATPNKNCVPLNPPAGSSAGSSNRTLVSARSHPQISPRSPNSKVIARVTLADEEDTRCGIAAAKRAFATFGRTTKEERAKTLRRLHEVVSARVDDLTGAMVEEYGGVVQFAAPIVRAGA